jgi:hypothetical protein
MGYTSDVVLAVRESTITTPDLPILACADRSYSSHGYRYYEWFCTKWYETFTDVKALEDWLDELDVNDLEEDYYLLRKGEELDDVTSRGSCYDSDVWLVMCTPSLEVQPESITYKEVIIGFLVVLVVILL